MVTLEGLNCWRSSYSFVAAGALQQIPHTWIQFFPLHLLGNSLVHVFSLQSVPFFNLISFYNIIIFSCSCRILLYKEHNVRT